MSCLSCFCGGVVDDTPPLEQPYDATPGTSKSTTVTATVQDSFIFSDDEAESKSKFRPPPTRTVSIRKEVVPTRPYNSNGTVRTMNSTVASEPMVEPMILQWNSHEDVANGITLAQSFRQRTNSERRARRESQRDQRHEMELRNWDDEECDRLMPPAYNGRDGRHESRRPTKRKEQKRNNSSLHHISTSSSQHQQLQQQQQQQQQPHYADQHAVVSPTTQRFYSQDEQVKYYNKNTNSWIEDARIVGIHHDDGPDKPYYTVRFGKTKSKLVEKQTTYDRLRPSNWGGVLSWDVNDHHGQV